MVLKELQSSEREERTEKQGNRSLSVLALLSFLIFISMALYLYKYKRSIPLKTEGKDYININFAELQKSIYEAKRKVAVSDIETLTLSLEQNLDHVKLPTGLQRFFSDLSVQTSNNISLMTTLQRSYDKLSSKCVILCSSLSEMGEEPEARKNAEAAILEAKRVLELFDSKKQSIIDNSRANTIASISISAVAIVLAAVLLFPKS